MPPKKRRTNGKKSKNTSCDTSQADEPRESHYSGFSEGLQASSSPEVPILDNRFRDFLKMSEEQLHIVVNIINLKFGELIAAFENNESLSNAVWVQGDLVEVTQSLIDAHNEAEVPSGSHGSHGTGSRKITWATPGEQTKSTRDGRRSKSADPSSRHTGTRVTRLSATYSYPDLKTPIQPSMDKFRYNIATVTPHPSKTSSITAAPLLRKPKLGETAISMSGSPLLVSSDHVSVPSVVVPLADGRVFNVLGNSSNVVREQLRNGLNSETVNKLKDLKNFINQLVP
uniref:Borealin n=1 Tax=Lygus hesperus TaxID=30085 RepID=A0A0A9WXJ0_LYGHE